MYRQLASRPANPVIYLSARRVPIASRKLSSTPPAQPGGSNSLIVLSALGALGALYYYYTRGQPAIDREIARHKEEEIRMKVNDIGEAGKSKVESAARQGQRDYDRAKATVQDAAATARGRATEARTDLTEKARQSAHDAQVKFDELKSTASRKISDAHDRSEKSFEEGREEISREVHDAGNKTRGWFGWGGSK